MNLPAITELQLVQAAGRAIVGLPAKARARAELLLAPVDDADNLADLLPGLWIELVGVPQAALPRLAELRSLQDHLDAVAGNELEAENGSSAENDPLLGDATGAHPSILASALSQEGGSDVDSAQEHVAGCALCFMRLRLLIDVLITPLARRDVEKLVWRPPHLVWEDHWPELRDQVVVLTTEVSADLDDTQWASMPRDHIVPLDETGQGQVILAEAQTWDQSRELIRQLDGRFRFGQPQALSRLLEGDQSTPKINAMRALSREGRRFVTSLRGLVQQILSVRGRDMDAQVCAAADAILADWALTSRFPVPARAAAKGSAEGSTREPLVRFEARSGDEPVDAAIEVGRNGELEIVLEFRGDLPPSERWVISFREAAVEPDGAIHWIVDDPVSFTWPPPPPKTKTQYIPIGRLRDRRNDTLERAALVCSSFEIYLEGSTRPGSPGL